MTITKDDLKAIMPQSVNIERFVDPLNQILEKYGITTPIRLCMFLANTADESGQLNYTHELWGPTYFQKMYERDFSRAWPPTMKDGRNNSAWSLGNSEPGDGFRFRGHGLIQTTGRANHEKLKQVFGIDFVANPELLEGPVWACESAGYYWMSAGCNAMADKGDFDGACDLVNRGKKTLAIGDSVNYRDRLAYFERAKTVLMPSA